MDFMKTQLKDLKKAKLYNLVFLAGSFLLFGLFKEYGACLYSGIWGIFLILRLKNIFVTQNEKGKKEKIKGENCFNPGIILAVGTIALFYLLTCFYGIDRGIIFIGFLKYLGVVFFLAYISLLEEEERKALRLLIPLLGCIMTIIGIVAKFVPKLNQFFYVARRLGGFFQYPNVFALFCLVGILLLIGAEKENVLEILLLLAGILLSGSRTVFFLTVFSAIAIFIHFRRYRKPIVILTVILGCVILVWVGIAGSFQTAGRFLTTSVNSSTLIGRIIYWKDGLSELLKHPFGLGYLGYYYREPVIQKAFYSVRFIHNDFLQIALDTGILSGIVFTIAFIGAIIRKELSFTKKLTLTVMLLHFFMDFDLEFTAMWYLLLLVAAVPQEKTNMEKLKQKTDNGVKRKAGKIIKVPVLENTVKGLIVICSLVSLYIGISMIPRYTGNVALSAKLLPFYTEANVEVLSAETDPDAAKKMADKILEQNQYVPEAYDIQAVLALGNGEYSQMIAEKKKSLQLQKYNMEAYDRYLALLAQGINITAQENDAENTELLLEAAGKVPALLKEVEEQTDPLAYKTKDIPDFTLSTWSQEFLQQVNEIIEE